MQMRRLATTLAVPALAIATGVVLILLVVSYAAYVRLGVQVGFALDQVKTIERLRNRAMSEDGIERKAIVRAIVSYYPSGTKHAKGTQLDEIVESYRDASLDMVEMVAE